MNAQIKELIEISLTDGIITPKEKAVILNKAEELGENVDEVEVYLEAALQKVEQTERAAKRQTMGQICPFCGKSVKMLETKCPHCESELSPQASADFDALFKEMQNLLVILKTGNTDEYAKNKARLESSMLAARTYYMGNPAVKRILFDIEQEVNAVEGKLKNAKRKKIALYFAAVFAILAVCFGTYTFFRQQADAKIQAEELRKEQEAQQLSMLMKQNDKTDVIDSQYDSLITKINELPTPTPSNYKECKERMMQIQWNTIITNPNDEKNYNYEQGKRDNFYHNVKGYARGLIECYWKMNGITKELTIGSSSSLPEWDGMYRYVNFGHDYKHN